MKSNLSRRSAALFLAAAFLMIGSLLRSAPPVGWYSAGSLGWNNVRTETITKVGTPFGDQPGGNAHFRNGFAAVGSAGWGLPQGLRFEGEAAYRRNSLYQATAGSLHDAQAEGSEKKSSLFVNALYECDRPNLPVSFYIGAGIGYNWIKWKDAVILDATETVRFNETKVKLGYQGIAGVAFLTNWLPGVSFTAEYRIRGLDGARTYHGQVLRSRFGAFPTSVTVSNSVDQTFLIGIRFQVPNPR